MYSGDGLAESPRWPVKPVGYLSSSTGEGERECALTARFHNALASLRNSAEPGLAAWATAKQKVIIPLLRAQLFAETS